MSIDFNLFCPETKSKIWIGQGTINSLRTDFYMNTLYSDEKDTMDALTKFLNDNAGRALYFCPSCTPRFEVQEYTNYSDLVSNMEKIRCTRCKHTYTPGVFSECPVCNLGNEYQNI